MVVCTLAARSPQCFGTVVCAAVVAAQLIGELWGNSAKASRSGLKPRQGAVGWVASNGGLASDLKLLRQVPPPQYSKDANPRDLDPLLVPQELNVQAVLPRFPPGLYDGGPSSPHYAAPAAQPEDAARGGVAAEAKIRAIPERKPPPGPARQSVPAAAATAKVAAASPARAVAAPQQRDRAKSKAIDARRTLFVGTLSRRENVEHRAVLRKLHRRWEGALTGWTVATKFVFCVDGLSPKEKAPLTQERQKYRDVRTFAGCAESRKSLKIKSLILMYMYVAEYSKDYHWFMRVEDDAFMSLGRMADVFNMLAKKQDQVVFVGTRATEREQAVKDGHLVGGCGLIFSRLLVAKVREIKVFPACRLDEDKCLSAWINKLVLPQDKWSDMPDGMCDFVNDQSVPLSAERRSGAIAPIVHGLPASCLSCLERLEDQAALGGVPPTLGGCLAEGGGSKLPIRCKD